MSYYFRLLEIIENHGGEINSSQIKKIYFKKFHEGNTVNLNRALRQVRKKGYNNGIDFRFERFNKGRTIIYWFSKNNKKIR
jgi:hypothetical protein